MIKSLNPNQTLPDERIVVVHNSGDDDDFIDNNNNGNSSGSLMLLNQYLGHPRLNWPKNDSIMLQDEPSCGDG